MRDAAQEEFYFDMLAGLQLAGAICLYPPTRITKANALAKQIPVVSIGDKPEGCTFDSVELDGRKTGYLMGEYLVGLGHTHITFVSTPIKAKEISRLHRLEGLKAALEHVEELARENEKTEVIEICGKTYANKSLKRYDAQEMADSITATTLSSLVDYIGSCSREFPDGDMIIHIVSPTKVKLISELDTERRRECLFETEAETSEYRFDKWYDQENFMISLQANFQYSTDLEAVMKLAGNIEKKNDQSFSDDGRTQVATMTVGVATKAAAIVPNPVELIPYRTFQEVGQPASKFVFRIGENNDIPIFKLIEAEGGIWKNEAVSNIKRYLTDALMDMPKAISSRITIIG